MKLLAEKSVSIESYRQSKVGNKQKTLGSKIAATEQALCQGRVNQEANIDMLSISQNSLDNLAKRGRKQGCIPLALRNSYSCWRNKTFIHKSIKEGSHAAVSMHLM